MTILMTAKEALSYMKDTGKHVIATGHGAVGFYTWKSILSGYNVSWVVDAVEGDVQEITERSFRESNLDLLFYSGEAMTVSQVMRKAFPKRNRIRRAFWANESGPKYRTLSEADFDGLAKALTLEDLLATDWEVV